MPFNAAKVKSVCKRVPPFVANSDFSFWFDARFLRVCEQEECSDDDRLECLLSLVPSIVYNKVVEISATPDITFAQTALRLKSFFSDELSPNSALRTLRGLKQEPGEGFRAFVDRLLRLAKIAHPDGQVLAEREVCLQAASGAACPKLKNDLSYESPETLERLFELYRKRKSAEECRVAGVLALADNRADEVAASNNVDFRKFESRLEAIEKSLATLLSTRQNTRKFNGNCYNCGQAGHRSNRCTQPKRDEEVQNTGGVQKN